MTYEELFDAYREVLSQRALLAAAGDQLWGELAKSDLGYAKLSEVLRRWETLRDIGTEPPVEDWAEC